MSDSADQRDEPFDESLVEHAARFWDAERENAQRLTGRETLILTAIAALFGLGLYRVEWYRGEHDVTRIQSGLAASAIKLCLSASLLFFAFAFGGLFVRYRLPVRPRYLFDRASVSLAQMVLRISAGYFSPDVLKQRRKRPPLANLIRLSKATVLRAQRIEPRPSLKLSKGRRASHRLALSPDFFENPPESAGVSRKLVFTCVYEAALELQRANARKEQNLDRFQILFFLGLVFVICAILVFILFAH